MTRTHWTLCALGFSVFILGVGAAVALYLNDALTPGAGGALAAVSSIGLAGFVYLVVRGVTRDDTEGVERQHAGRAALIALATLGVGGLSYSLFEAFVGLPRLTAAVPAVGALALWAIIWGSLMHRDAVEND